MVQPQHMQARQDEDTDGEHDVDCSPPLVPWQQLATPDRRCHQKEQGHRRRYCRAGPVGCACHVEQPKVLTVGGQHRADVCEDEGQRRKAHKPMYAKDDVDAEASRQRADPLGQDVSDDEQRQGDQPGRKRDLVGRIVAVGQVSAQRQREWHEHDREVGHGKADAEQGSHAG